MQRTALKLLLPVFVYQSYYRLRWLGYSPKTTGTENQHVPGYAHLPPHRRTTLYHRCARSSASGRSHMQVLPHGTLCLTTSAPWLILSSSENC